jgi:hypothetical protein
MVRVADMVAVAAVLLSVVGPMPAHADPSLVSSWQHCESGKGCAKFAFLPNGRVIEQFDLAGSKVTAYGRYEIKDTVLEIAWQQFAPPQICGSSPAGTMAAGEHCASTSQPDLKGPFRFDGLNALVWSKADGPPLRLLRVQL